MKFKNYRMHNKKTRLQNNRRDKKIKQFISHYIRIAKKLSDEMKDEFILELSEISGI